SGLAVVISEEAALEGRAEGILSPPSLAPEAVGAVLTGLAQDRERLLALRQAARRTALEFDWAVTVKRFEEAMEQVEQPVDPGTLPVKVR
ncbi:MAG: hypothetical protein HQL51_15440, partial [Magnetococcales bacterium]|nr:hypothetical protein [Magnetococcales bacterium]